MYSVGFDYTNPLNLVIWSFALIGFLGYILSILILYHVMIDTQTKYVKKTRWEKFKTFVKACIWPFFLIYWTVWSDV